MKVGTIILDPSLNVAYQFRDVATFYPLSASLLLSKSLREEDFYLSMPDAVSNFHLHLAQSKTLLVYYVGQSHYPGTLAATVALAQT